MDLSINKKGNISPGSNKKKKEKEFIPEDILKKLEDRADALRELYQKDIKNEQDKKNYIKELKEKVNQIISDVGLDKIIEGAAGMYIKSSITGDIILIPIRISGYKENYVNAMEVLKSNHWVFNKKASSLISAHKIKIKSKTLSESIKIYHTVAEQILSNPTEENIHTAMQSLRIEKKDFEVFKQYLENDLRQISKGNSHSTLKPDLGSVKDEDIHNLIIATFLNSLAKSPNLKDSGALIIYEPGIGGVALRAPESQIEENSDFLGKFYRRFILLIKMNEGMHKFINKKPPYYRKICNDELGKFLEGSCNNFIRDLILTRDIKKRDLCVDKKGIFITERLGNKRKTKKEKIMVVRLYVGTNEAFNFLYHNNAENFAKIENYMNGVLYGYKKGGKLDEIKKLRLDVYINPKINDINAMDINPIVEKKKGELAKPIENESNFSYYFESHKDLLNSKIFKKFKFVIYLYSELVGPSIFPAEITAGIAYEGIDKGIFHAPVAPVKILDLFSGTGACELSVAKKMGVSPEKVSILGLDLNPHRIEFAKSKKYPFHTVQTDIFSFFKQTYESDNEMTFSNYDIVTADPHHFMILDFLYKKFLIKDQKDNIKEVPFFEWLSKHTHTYVFVLYFGHKEKEFMGFFINRVMSSVWNNVYSVIIGDERIIITNNFEEKKRKKFEKILKQVVKEIENKYEMKSRGLKTVILNKVLDEIQLQ